MPVIYNQPAAFQNANVEDVNRFQQLPFYLVMNEVATFPSWNIFDQLFGEIDWQSNEGTTMRGTTPQPSPVGRSFFFPNEMTTLPNKDIYQVTESIEQTTLKRHRYESYQFNFLPSFTAFWRNYLKFANKDIVTQIARSNNQFIETNLWFNAPNVYLAGSGLLTGAPTNMGNDAGTAAGSKTNAWLAAAVIGTGAGTGVINNLSLRNVYNAFLNLQEDLGAPAFEGARNMPKDNEGLKNRYVLVTSSEAWANFTYDPDVLNKLNGLAPCDLNLVFNDFKGLLFGNIVTKIHRYPIRFNIVDIKDGAGTVLYAAGTPIAPEIYDNTDKKSKPNPYYTSLQFAPYEISWLLGADTCRTIKVGPPPSEFANKNMSAEKFYAMRWNGEVRLTDQVLITYSDGSVDLNDYGEQLKFKSQCTHGYLVGERRYSIPIVFERVRPSALAA